METMKQKYIHIYFFGIFMTGAMGKVGYKTLFSIASWKWVWNTFKIFFFFFFLVRETNRAMYNLQVETETRTNQYQFPVYFGPKLQPKKKKNPLLVNFVWGEEFHGTAILCWTLWNFQSHPRGAKNTVNRVSFNPLTSTPSVKVPYLAYARHLIWLDTFSYMVNPI